MSIRTSCTDGRVLVDLAESVRQVTGERSYRLHLLGGGRLLKALSDEYRLFSAPNQGREAALGHEPGRADIAKGIFRRFRAALHESHKPVALKDEVRDDFGGDDLNPRRG